MEGQVVAQASQPAVSADFQSAGWPARMHARLDTIERDVAELRQRLTERPPHSISPDAAALIAGLLRPSRPSHP